MLSDLKKLAEAMSPDMIIPIHSFYPDQFQHHFSHVRCVEDGEIITL
jgi:mRNA degradation ribonuclease J1/J2